MDGLKRLLAEKNNWLWLYLGVMVPTYILPYMGSNSLLAGAVSFGATLPLFLIHLAALVALCIFAHIRGPMVGKSWLLWLPVGAAIFDMVPVLNWIPLVPTVFHVIAVVMGMENTGPKDQDVFN